jgi:hypothetical protein
MLCERIGDLAGRPVLYWKRVEVEVEVGIEYSKPVVECEAQGDVGRGA